MFDLLQKSDLSFTGNTGLVFWYRPIPYCYGLEVQKIVVAASKGIITQHAGNADAARNAAQLQAGEVLLQERSNLLHLLLRVCLRRIDGLKKGGENVVVPLEPTHVGGFETNAVPTAFINQLLDVRPVADDLAALADIIEAGSTLTDEGKKKSADGGADDQAGQAESVQDVPGDLSQQDASE